MKDPRVDAYIERSAAFARPILIELRARVHRACPEVDETLRWGTPSFTYNGRILAGMAAFKAHATFGFWRREVALKAGLDGAEHKAMGQFGRLTDLRQLPPRAVFSRMVREAKALIDRGEAPTARSLKHPRGSLEVPADLAGALARNAAACRTFEGFPPSHRGEYIEWIIDAKRPATRLRRLAQTLEWLAQGKRRNWKYERC